MRGKGNQYGTHRVLDPQGALPQAALKLDSTLPLYSNEIRVEVDCLNIDSTSFKQLCQISADSPSLLEKNILKILSERGKLHNPITNSGGMLLGTVTEIGSEYRGSLSLKVGDRIATLVSLTLTPLHLEKIHSIDLKTGQIKVSGHALLFESVIACKMPEDLPEPIALAVLDVCGAPSLVVRHAQKKDHVLFVGAGKSAKLSAAALKKIKPQVHIACIDVDTQSLEEMKSMRLADEIIVGDATQAGGLPPSLQNIFDLVVNVTNVAGTEMTSILAVKEGGIVLFFGMGTSFQKVALGAEGIGKDATFLIGNGYAKGHAELALKVVQENPDLKKWFEKKYCNESA